MNFFFSDCMRSSFLNKLLLFNPFISEIKKNVIHTQNKSDNFFYKYCSYSIIKYDYKIITRLRTI